MPNKKQDHNLQNHKKFTAYLNKLCQSSLEKDQRIYRLYRAAERNTPKELASFLNVSTVAINKVKRSGKIPAEWLLFILRVKNIHPDWIVMGKGPIYVERTQEGYYQSATSNAQYYEMQNNLQGLSSYILAEELLRRIANQENKTEVIAMK